MSRQIRKNGKIYASDGGGDHERMHNRRGAGLDGEAYHLDKDAYSFVMATMAGAPLAPLNVSPADGETNAYQFPEFVGSPYVSPRDTPMLGMEIKIGLDPDVLTPVYEGYMETAQTTARFAGFEAVIQPGEAYFWSVRYVDADGRKGNWSVPTGFTTAAEFQDTVVLRPQIAYPQEGARVSPVDPMLITTPFRIEGATDSHESTDWQIASRADFDPDHVLAESLDDASNLTSIVFGGLDVTGDNGFYARARHGAANAGKSQWSPIRHALLKEFHDDYLIGVGITEGGAVYWIDGQGNRVSLRNGYFDGHPCYQLPETEILGNVMKGVSETHVRCDAGQGGFAYRYWLSPAPFSGSMPHPAFANAPDGILYYGKYLCGSETSVEGTAAVSVANSKPGCYVRKFNENAIQSAIADLNANEGTDGSGWHFISVYDKALLTLLMLTELRSLSFSGLFGTILPSANTIAANAWYRGISYPFFTGISFNAVGNSNTPYCSELLMGYSGGAGNSASRSIALPTDINSFKSIGKQASSSSTAGSVYFASFDTRTDPDIGPLQLLFLSGDIGSGGLGVRVTQGSSSYVLTNAAYLSEYGVSGPTFPALFSSTGHPYTTRFARLCKYR